MNIKDFFVEEHQTLQQVMKTIDKAGYGIALVVKNQKLLGIVTDSDIRRSLLQGTTLDTTVDAVMNKNPITLREEEVKNINLENFPLYGMTQVPIVDNQNNIIDVLLISKKEIIGRLLDDRVHKKVKRVLVVGGAGYLGSVLCEKLLDNGYQVRVLDNLTYGDDGIKKHYAHSNYEFVYGDMRNIQTVVKAIKDVDAVIHLAAIVGDPACDLNPEETIESNYLASKMLAEICKYSQINRFIFASTCSVYGASKTNGLLTERSALNPVSLYAKMKLKSEQGILELEDENFAPTIFRMATLYGTSYRMRFDLVVNIMTIKALREHQLTVFGGKQWRALCHVRDAADVYISCLEAPVDKIKGQTFNITTENYQIKEIGNMINSKVLESELVVKKGAQDIRSYKVSSKKVKDTLDMQHILSIEDAVEEIDMSLDDYYDYNNSKYSNYKYLKGE